MLLRRYVMLYKHIILNKSFIITLLLVPLLVSIFMFSGQRKEGYFSIGIKASDDNYEFVKSVMDMDTIIDFVRIDEKEDPKEAVINGIVDSVWVIDDNLKEELMDCINKGEYHPVVHLMNKDESISIRYANILLDCLLFKEASPLIFDKYASKFPVYLTNVEKFQEVVKKRRESGKFIESKYLENVSARSAASFPLRGILGLFLVLLGMLVSINLSKDYEKGLFVWWNSKNTMVRDYLYYLGPMLVGTLVMVIALYVCGEGNGILREVISAFLLMSAVIVSSNFIRNIIVSYHKMSILLPVILLVNLVFCPIFVKFRMFLEIRLLLPLFYYLRGMTYDIYFYGIMIYIFVLIILGIFLDKIKGKFHYHG